MQIVEHFDRAVLRQKLERPNTEKRKRERENIEPMCTIVYITHITAQTKQEMKEKRIQEFKI